MNEKHPCEGNCDYYCDDPSVNYCLEGRESYDDDWDMPRYLKDIPCNCQYKCRDCEHTYGSKACKSCDFYEELEAYYRRKDWEDVIVVPWP